VRVVLSTNRNSQCSTNLNLVRIGSLWSNTFRDTHPYNYTISPNVNTRQQFSTNHTADTSAAAAACKLNQYVAQADALALKSAIDTDTTTNAQVETLLNDWNIVLKQLSGGSHQQHQPHLIAPYVSVVDDLVRTILLNHSKHTHKNKALALDVGLAAWSRRTSDESCTRAQALFDLYDSFAHTTSVHRRRAHYNLLLLTWSRSFDKTAPVQMLAILKQMSHEGETCGTRLVDARALDRLLAAFAKQGNVEQVRRLWKLRNDSDIAPTSFSYTWHIKAYRVAYDQLQQLTVREEDNDLDSKTKQQSARQAALELFAENMDAYAQSRNEALLPHVSTLQLLIGMLDAHQGLELLERALQFEVTVVGKVGSLVNELVYSSVMQNLVRANQVEIAEKLLLRLLDQNHLKAKAKHFGIIMNGYSKRNSPGALRRLEAMISLLENPASSYRSCLNVVMYTILMEAYLTVLPDASVSPIERTFQRMSNLSTSIPELRPDLFSYTCLMKAHIQQKSPGFAVKVQQLMDEIVSELRFQNDDLSVARGVCINAWAKSDAPDKVMHAERIFGRTPRPNTILCNTLIAVYADQRRPADAIALLDRMLTEFDNGVNRHCQPDHVTFMSVLQAIKRSGGADSWEMALQIFERMMLGNKRDELASKPVTDIVATLFLVLASRLNSSDNHIEAGKVLKYMEAHGISHSERSAHALLKACRVVTGDVHQKRAAFCLVTKSLVQLGPKATSELYVSVLIACLAMIDNEGERSEMLVDLFRMCDREGLVTDNVLTALQRVLSSERLRQLFATGCVSVPFVAIESNVRAASESNVRVV
jgi:pentatricopeptide repeat protein